MSTENVKQEGLYYYVVDGTFRRRVAEGTPGSVVRHYEIKSTKAQGTKHEMVIDSLEGYIMDMGIHDSEFGRSLDITLDPNEKGVHPNLQFGVENSFGEDVLKKIPHIDFTKPVKFRPYAFTEQTSGREVRGVEVSQEGNKYKNFFWDFENKKELHGIPVPEGDRDAFTKDDWKIHFLSVRKFLINYFTENVYPKMAATEKPEVVRNIPNTDIPYPTDEGYSEEEDIPYIQSKPENNPF